MFNIDTTNMAAVKVVWLGEWISYLLFIAWEMLAKNWPSSANVPPFLTAQIKTAI